MRPIKWMDIFVEILKWNKCYPTGSEDIVTSTTFLSLGAQTISSYNICAGPLPSPLEWVTIPCYCSVIPSTPVHSQSSAQMPALPHICLHSASVFSLWHITFLILYQIADSTVPWSFVSPPSYPQHKISVPNSTFYSLTQQAEFFA